jgi:hypothetical protein
VIEELTPQVVGTSVLLVLLTAPVVTLALSILLLWAYRRAVTQAMAASGGFEASAGEPDSTSASPSHDRQAGEPRTADLYRQAVRVAWRNAARYLLAGFVFALAFATAAQFVFPFQLGLPGFVTGVWIYLWPAALALLVIVPGSLWLRAGWVAVYFVVLVLLGLWMSTVTNLPEYRFGGLVLPARSTVTPFTLGRLWLIANAGPTLLMLLCFNRWVRAVAPLVLAVATAVIAGTWIAMLALFSPRGIELGAGLAVWLNVHAGAVVLGIVVLSLALFAALGWTLARWVARAYREKRVSDQSLLLDAVWLLFASAYAIWLVFGGLVWVATAPVAFVAYKLVLAATRRRAVGERAPVPGLTFLRVFSLGRRSEQLLNQVARHWRQIGSVQMITGPDLARSTVQPHQFLDFLSGKLARHFVRDRASLERATADQDRAPDPDGRFRINNIFCHADSWQQALRRLTRDGDMVLMDLRRFSASNTGCLHELRYLVDNVPLGRCVLVVDDTTDAPYLDRTLQKALEGLPSGSPNHGSHIHDVPVYNLDSRTGSLRRLIQRLCAAGAVCGTSEERSFGSA